MRNVRTLVESGQKGKKGRRKKEQKKREILSVMQMTQSHKVYIVELLVVSCEKDYFKAELRQKIHISYLGYVQTQGKP